MLQLRSSLETLEKLQLGLQGKEATGLQKGGLAKGNTRSCVTVGSDLVTMSYVQTAKRAWKSCKLRKFHAEVALCWNRVTDDVTSQDVYDDDGVTTLRTMRILMGLGNPFGFKYTYNLISRLRLICHLQAACLLSPSSRLLVMIDHCRNYQEL